MKIVLNFHLDAASLPTPNLWYVDRTNVCFTNNVLKLTIVAQTGEDVIELF